MGFPKRQAVIAGVYLTEQAPRIARSSAELEIEAFVGALADAGLTPADVDGIATPRRESVVSGSYDPHYYWAEQLGQQPINFMTTGLGSGALVKAALGVSAGMCDTVVLVYAKAGSNLNPAKAALPDTPERVGDWSYRLTGGTHPGWYAAWTRRYMHEFGATSEQLAEVAVAARLHAVLNPDSIMGSRGPITVDDVVNSRMIADPLRLLDCCLDNDGGYAVVITTAERARDLRRPPVYILGGAESAYVDYYLNFPYPTFPEHGGAVRTATDIAFSMAGVTRDDIDVAGLYDCFTITVVRDLEEMGFCKLGEGADYIQGGTIRLGGKLPVNPHGGLMSCSHNSNPAGMHTIEVVRQLRGDVEPARQVPDAKLGVALAQGMSVHGGCGVLIVGVD